MRGRGTNTHPVTSSTSIAIDCREAIDSLSLSQRITLQHPKLAVAHNGMRFGTSASIWSQQSNPAVFSFALLNKKLT